MSANSVKTRGVSIGVKALLSERVSSLTRRSLPVNMDKVQSLERTQLVKITVREFLDDILNTNSMHIIVR